MSLVKRNVVANLLGGALLTALTVVITPLQINILGMEAYGVVGLITTLQIAFTAFDLGLSSTLTRELAADSSVNKQESARLLRTASTIYWLTAIVIGLLIASLAGPLARRWFHSRSIDESLLEQSLQVIALYLALRWPVALYSGVLIGLQRMDVLNAVKVVTASIRLVGGVLILLHWRSLYAFLVWTAISALIEVTAFWFACRWAHPSMPIRPGISAPALSKVWRFSLSMNGLAILTVLIVQVDRLMISKMLPLDALGNYTLAYNTSAIVPALIAALGSAVMPSFAAAHGEGSTETLLRRYDSASRFMLYVIGLVVAGLVFFGEPLLAVWVNPAAGAAAARPLALLAIGFGGSAVASNAYQVAIASGRPNLALRLSVLSAPLYVVALYWLISELGIVGAALAWLLLNIGYVAFLVPAVHRNILHIPVWPYALRIVFPFALLALISFGSLKSLTGLSSGSAPVQRDELLAFLGAAIVYLGVGYLFLGDQVQKAVRSSLGLSRTP